MTEVYNTPFEVSLRILIILNTVRDKLTIDRIAALDFITTYGKDFGVSEYNLHGDNNFKFSEFASKRKIVSQAIKEIVLKGYVESYCNKSGFYYGISKSGVSFCESLSDDYADNLTNIVKTANNLFSNYSDRKLIKFINEHAIARFGGEG